MITSPCTSAAPLPVMPAGLPSSVRDKLNYLITLPRECAARSSAAALTVAVISHRTEETIGDEAKAQTHFSHVTGKASALFRRYRRIG